MTALAQLPLEQPSLLQAAPQLRALAAQGPIHEIRTATGDPAWLVTGYEEVWRLLADSRLGRSHPDPGSAARTGESVLFGGPLGSYETEDADHARMRSLLQPHFAPGRMRALRPRVDALAAGLLDELARRDPPADLIEALAVPLPVLVICELLGVPYGGRDRFRAWTRAAADVRDRARSEQGLADLFGYGRQLVARKREQPGDDVISRLCAAGRADENEIAMLSMFVLFAGHETTVTAIGMGALMLLTHPRQWQTLRDDPALVPAAVEELLRAPGQGGGGIPRYAREDLEISGARVRAGDLVLLDNGAANHDADAFPDPDRFDITRQAGSHLTFGHGARYCIGAPLARIELQAVFSQLIHRFPDLRLAVAVEELTLDTAVLTGGLTRLPVAW
jgi:pentalenolactone synthase